MNGHPQEATEARLEGSELVRKRRRRRLESQVAE